jgi:hypothetical protein
VEYHSNNGCRFRNERYDCSASCYSSSESVSKRSTDGASIIHSYYIRIYIAILSGVTAQLAVAATSM